MATGFASADSGAARYAPGSFESVDQAIEAGSATAFSFLERLVAAPSTVGREAAAQEIVAAELASLGFGVSRVPVPPAVAAQPPGGVAPLGYNGRHDILGRINPGAGPALLINGHIDVVPAQAAQWSRDPFAQRCPTAG